VTSKGGRAGRGERGTHLGEGTPRHRLRVERLDLLARPDVGALRVEEQLALRADDLLHDDELEDGADDGAERLDEEGRAGRELGVLSHLEVTSEPETLAARVGAVPVCVRDESASGPCRGRGVSQAR